MKLDLPAGVMSDEGRGGLPRLRVATDRCTAELYLHGAHLCAWQPRSQPHPVLWMSQASRFEAGAPIRGGVPICFPWFGPKIGDASAPAHGIARINAWTLDRVEVERDGTAVITLSLASDARTRDAMPHDVALTFAVRLGDTLTMALTVANSGHAPLTFEEALHTYFAVSDVRQVRVEGLAGATFVDKTDGGTRKMQDDAVITISGETDRLFLNTLTAITLTDPGFGRRITVSKTGSLSSVVWNPWIAKSRAMSDFGDDEWPAMICIETANAADNAVTLTPGASHTMTAAISLAGLTGSS
jgi:glucose-6-phosphate 1-epimerase